MQFDDVVAHPRKQWALPLCREYAAQPVAR
jgi:hypothetical protein